MYLITKDIFGTWKKGKVITEEMVQDYLKFNHPILADALICEWRVNNYIKPYAAKSKKK